MKIKTTNKEIKANAYTIVSIGYCDAHYLLKGINPFAYTCGTYGWNADFYQVGNVVISTGYRPIGTRKPYGTTTEYEAKASAVWNDSRSYNEYDYDQRKADSNAILHDYINAD